MKMMMRIKLLEATIAWPTMDMEQAGANMCKYVNLLTWVHTICRSGTKQSSARPTIRLSRLPPRLKLRNHPFNLDRLRSGCPIPQLLERGHILRFEGFFASFCDHAAFHPHLNAVCDRQIGAFRYKCRGELGVAGAEDFVVEGL